MEDLKNVKNNLAGSYCLTADIDLSTESNWEPIGAEKETDATNGVFDGSQFTGTFDGQGHTIRGLTINRATTDYIGLFAVITTSATVSNLTIDVAEVKGNESVGALVGESTGNIDNVVITGGKISGNSYIGGLAGTAGTGILSNSGSVVEVEGSTQQIGGLIGRCRAPLTIENSYATGNVTGADIVGGLIGGLANIGTIIKNSYATGNVTGANYVGGLAGALSSTAKVHNSYTTSTVSLTSGSSSTGIAAFHGQIFPGTTLLTAPSENNYFDESKNPSRTANMRGDEFSVTGVSAAANIAPSGTGFVDTQGTTDTSDDTPIFVGWDKATIWTIEAGKWPTLQWQN